MIVCSFDLTIDERHHYSGASNGRVPPDPIPNSEVKPSSTDDTWAASSPGKVSQRQNFGVFCYKKREPTRSARKVGNVYLTGGHESAVNLITVLPSVCSAFNTLPQLQIIVEAVLCESFFGTTILPSSTIVAPQEHFPNFSGFVSAIVTSLGLLFYI